MKSHPGLVHVCVILNVLALALPAQAQGDGAAPAPSDEAKHEAARRLFSQGRVAYDLGQYADAVEKFKAAYEQVQEPAFLFNIAQAYRLNSECLHAVDSYRHFLRLSPASGNREAAERHVAALEPQCPRPPPVPVPPAKLQPAASLEVKKIEPPRAVLDLSKQTAPVPAKRPRPWAYAALGAGAAMAAVSLGLGAWNSTEYQQWSTEDDFLANPSPGTAADVLLQRQENNDERLASINRTEQVVWGFAIGAALFVAAGVVVAILNNTTSREQRLVRQ